MTDQDTETLKAIPPEAVAYEATIGARGLASGDDGTAEAKQLTRGLSARDLRQESQEAEHDRNEKFRDHFELIAVVAMWSLSGSGFIIGFLWMYHLVTPDSWHWLSDSKLEKIQNIFAGVVLAGLLADHFKKRLN